MTTPLTQSCICVHFYTIKAMPAKCVRIWWPLPAVWRVEGEENRLGNVSSHLPYTDLKFQPGRGSVLEVIRHLMTLSLQQSHSRPSVQSILCRRNVCSSGGYFRPSGGRRVKDTDWLT